VIRAERSVLIVETRQGFVCANAGIDSSNLAAADSVCLLPEDPDASARTIRDGLRDALDPKSKVRYEARAGSAEPEGGVV